MISRYYFSICICQLFRQESYLADLIEEIHKTDGTIGYMSWKRGTNENTNRLIRQYFTQNQDFSTITQHEIDTAMKRLKNRPRK